ncbi:MAG TPA: antibiotic biosynthesis monooxygenase family protein [Stenotrophomonas sp.]|nr:antibiotic biosynthesis monooxygenase family protein [Stenotrophomonas sp.]
MSRTPNPIVVIARWTMAAASLAEVLALLPDLQRQTLLEPGCLGYEILQSAEAPNTLVLIERYRDAQAIAAHRESAHYRAIVAGRIVPLLVERQVDLLSAIA